MVLSSGTRKSPPVRALTTSKWFAVIFFYLMPAVTSYAFRFKDDSATLLAIALRILVNGFGSSTYIGLFENDLAIDIQNLNHLLPRSLPERRCSML